MRLESWLRSSQIAKLDAEIIAAFVLGGSRTWVHAHLEHQLTKAEQQQLDLLKHQRLRHEPLAYILGFKEFYGRDFGLTSDVLVPRPESEDFIEIIKTLEAKDFKFIDIGTGSGCLAVTIALEQTSWSGTATDVSQEALNVAKQNAKNLKAKNLVFKVQNLLAGDDQNYDLVIANLPYVPNNLRDKPDLAHEPEVALFAEHDGLALYEELFQQIATRTSKPAHILTESLIDQHYSINGILENEGYQLRETRGLIQHFVRA